MGPFHINEVEVSERWELSCVHSKSVTCEIIRDFGRLEAMASEWQRLWHSDSSAQFFQSFGWAQAWWSAFGENSKLCVAVVRQNDQAVFILPTVRDGRTLRFLGSPQSDYADAICSPGRNAEQLALCFRTLLLEYPEWRECVLDHLRPDSHIVRCWNEMPSDLRRRMHLEISYGCPTIDFEGKKDDALGVLLAGKHLRRRYNKLHKAGRLTFRHIEDRTEAQRHLTRFFRCHRRRCAALAKKSCFDNTEMRMMMQTLVNQMDLRKELRFGVLELDGRPLAWSFGFQSHGKYSYYQQTFDIDAEEYAPGEVLLRFLLLYSKENVEREFDFLRGDEFFKKRYATKVNQCYRLYVEQPGFAGQASRLKRAVEGQVRRVASAAENYVRNRESIFQHFRSYLIWKRDWTRRVQWANQNGNAAKYVFSASSSTACRKLWKKNVATVFKSSRTTIADSSPVDPEAVILSGRLSDLADLALEHPEIPFPTFREYRNRFKRGDEVYFVCLKGQLTLIVWTMLVNRGSAGSEPSLALYECWPIGDATQACACLLKRLTEKASQKNLQLAVSCSALPVSCRNAIRKQGFSAYCEIRSYSFLGGQLLRRVKIVVEPVQESHQDLTACPKLRDGHACVALPSNQTGNYGPRN